MPCIVDISPHEEINHYQVLLCKACKFLTIEQIESLKNANSGIQDGIEWYANHLWLDCIHNDNDALSISDGSEEKKIALKELSRIGFELITHENGSEELIECNPIEKSYPY